MKQVGSFTDFSYDWAARNAIDVGQYFGYCLAALSNRLVFGFDLNFLVNP